jgi:hypothetical protein
MFRQSSVSQHWFDSVQTAPCGWQVQVLVAALQVPLQQVSSIVH